MQFDIVENKKNTQKNLRSYVVNGEVKKIETLRKESDSENSFIYVTHKGEIGVEDIRCKSSAMRFDIGRERGIVSTMTVSEKNKYEKTKFNFKYKNMI